MVQMLLLRQWRIGFVPSDTLGGAPGLPSPSGALDDIHLGDVVVSFPQDGYGRSPTVDYVSPY